MKATTLRRLSALTIALGGCAASARAGLLIDDFTVEQSVISPEEANSVPYPFLQDRFMGAYMRVGSGTVAARSGQGRLDVLSPATGRVHFGLSYGVFVIGNSAYFRPATDFDMSLWPDYAIDVLAADGEFDVQVNEVEVHEVGVFNFRTYRGLAVVSSTAYRIILGAQSIRFESPGFDRSRVDYIEVKFLARTNGGAIALSRITAVPEPGVLASLSLGLLALFRRRRQRP